MLDVVHDTSWLANHHDDSNTYVLGSIGAHNVVMACLPADAYGTTSAANVAGHMMRAFPALRTRLMVGIGGGVPISDVRLGDVVVSTKVWQYDLGKTVQDGAFQRTGVSWRPPADIMTAVQVLKSRHEVDGHRIAETVAAMVESHPAMVKYAYPQTLRDCVFRPEYDHELGMPNCER
jgi:nucleoside phosphorylase